MPPAAKVDIIEAIEAVCALFPSSLRNGTIPAYSDVFYSEVSKKLNQEWSAHNVYINLKNDRRQLKSKVFAKLNIKVTYEKVEEKINTADCVNIDVNNINFCDTDAINKSDDDASYENLSNDSRDYNKLANLRGPSFELCIKHEAWKEMKPINKIYKNKNYLVLPPGIWTDIVADNFWRQYRMPCAFSFKKASVSLDPGKPFIHIIGKCKSETCKNTFEGISEREPIGDEDLWISVYLAQDTRDVADHEIIQRQLRNHKRKMIGTELLQHGAANCRRNIARNEIEFGDVKPPILYSGDVLRKLLQERRDEELGVNPADGNDSLLILRKLRFTPPYIGSIVYIGLCEPQLQYLLPEQVVVYKEYCNLFKGQSKICIDSTGSVVSPIQDIDNNVSSPVTFLYELVINFDGITVSVGQMFSCSHDANSILFWLNKWLSRVKVKAKEITCDYSRALLASISLAFNELSIKSYMEKCFSFITENKKDRPAATYIRIDVAHFINIFCRLKCFTKNNQIIKDFLIRCIALMVSCDNFHRFEEILLLTMIISIQKYDGQMSNSKLLSPAEDARIKLLKLIETEKHQAMKLIPDEDSEEFKKIFEKLESTGLNLNPSKSKCFVYEQPEVPENIKEWLARLKSKAEEGIDVIHAHVNPYRLVKFYEHLCRFAPEFMLWTGVMCKQFKSETIRATSCYVEGDFNELKNNILKGVRGTMRLDKVFRIHFAALQGQAKIALSTIVTTRMRMTKKKPIEDPNEDSDYSEVSFDQECKPLAHSSAINLQNEELPSDLEKEENRGESFLSDHIQAGFQIGNMNLEAKENWRNKLPEENIILSQNICVNLEQDNFDSHLNEKNLLENICVNSEQDNFDSNLNKKNLLENICVNSEQDNFDYNLNEKNLLNNNFDSILNEKENWRKKFREDNNLIQTTLKIEEKINIKVEKRKAEKLSRKPTKYFQTCHDIEARQKASKNLRGIQTTKMLLLNGNNFLAPIEVNGVKYIVHNTCPFDSIAEILAQGAIDNDNYLNYLENSTNTFCNFIALYSSSGAQPNVYGDRCLILKEFKDPQIPANKRKINEVMSPRLIHSFDVYSCVFDMWTFLIQNEPSMYFTKECNCGLVEIVEVPVVDVDHRIIANEGFQSLQKAILRQNATFQEPCPQETCTFHRNVKVNLNRHMFVEADIRMSTSLRTSMSCKIRDFPVHLHLQDETFRLTGIITHNGSNHYIALCRQINGIWEEHNDCNKKVTTLKKKDYNSAIIPQVAIYIKTEEEG